MRGTLILFRLSLRRHRALLGGACALLFAFQVVLILVARGLEETGGFAQIAALIPDFVKQWVNVFTPTFSGMVSFAYSHPVVLVALIAIAIAIGTEPAGEVESGFVDLLMARPVTRGAAVDRSAGALLAATAAAVSTMMLGTWIGLLLLAPATTRGPEPRVILSLAANLALVVLAWGAIALAIGSLSRRRAAAAGAAGLLVLAMFLLDLLGRLWEPTHQLSRLSPFHYFSPFRLIGGAPLAGRDVAVLGAIALAGFAVARIGYARRDL